MEIGELSQNKSLSISSDPLDQLKIDVLLLIEDLTKANAYPNSGTLGSSIDISLIAQEVIKVSNEMEQLKNGTEKDRAAYNSPECQKILNFLNGQPFGDGVPSLVTLAKEGDYHDLAITIWLFKDANLLMGKNGIVGLLSLFQLHWLQPN